MSENKPLNAKTNESTKARPTWFWLPALLVFLLVSTLLVRAVTMSMTADEAFTVIFYAAQPERIFSAEDFWPNNHVLHTLLVRGMFLIAPWQDGAMRLPALAAGIGVILILWRLGSFLFGASGPATKNIFVFLLIGTVTLHPLVFQFLSFARGYGMSLFFSLLGFFLLLRWFQTVSEETEKNTWFSLVFPGFAFGLSVASNLTAALMNTALIAAVFIVILLSKKLRFGKFVSMLPGFCLSGGTVVLILYGNIFLHVPLGQFDYASGSPWEGILDPISYALGRCDVVPLDSIQRLFLGIPIPEDLYWLLLALTPFLLGPVVLITVLVIGSRMLKNKTVSLETVSPAEAATLMLLLGMVFYAVLLCVAWGFGKNLFPKDRTGVLPIAYASMLLVLLAYGLENSTIRRLAAVGLVVYLVHLTTLFSYPYYHNIWYGDADIRNMMQTLKKENHSSILLVCQALNESSIEYYKEKYEFESIRIERILQTDAVDEISKREYEALYILPDREAEAVIQRNTVWQRIYYRNPYTGLILIFAGRTT